MNDFMHEWTEEQLKQLESDILNAYNSASYEVRALYSDEISTISKQIDKIDTEILKAEKLGMDTANLTASKAKILTTTLTSIKSGFVESVAKAINETNVEATALMRAKALDIFVENYNYSEYLTSKTLSTVSGLDLQISFDLLDKNTVKKLLTENTSLLPQPTMGADDIPWNQTKIRQSITQGITKGESVQQIADRLVETVGMNENQALRNARTAVTGSQNAGRNESWKENRDKLAEYGIVLRKKWLATSDGRTRESHRLLNGTLANQDTEKFANGLEYPGDLSGKPSEVYNCRCTMTEFIEGMGNTFTSEEEYNRWVSENGNIY